MTKAIEIVDKYAHNYRDIAMSEDTLAIMLHEFYMEVVEACEESVKEDVYKHCFDVKDHKTGPKVRIIDVGNAFSNFKK